MHSVRPLPGLNMPAKGDTMALQHRAEIEVVDVHVEGGLHRIILGGVKPLPGATVLEQMQYLRSHGDGLRQLVLNEPRGGRPSLFADLVVPPCLPEADAGYIIMETMGYPLISGNPECRAQRRGEGACPNARSAIIRCSPATREARRERPKG